MKEPLTSLDQPINEKSGNHWKWADALLIFFLFSAEFEGKLVCKCSFCNGVSLSLGLMLTLSCRFVFFVKLQGLKFWPKMNMMNLNCLHQGSETLYRRPIQILIAIAPSWGRSDALHYFRKSCCLFDMLNYSKEP